MLELHTTGGRADRVPDNHSDEVREGEEEKKKKSYPSVLVFCQGVPIDLLNLCDWNKCKWR